MKKILPLLIAGLIIGLCACEKNEYDDLGPDKSVWANGNFNGSGGTNDPGEDPVTKESRIEVNFYSSNLDRPTGLEIRTSAFPAIRENYNAGIDLFEIQAISHRLNLQITAPHGLFGPGQILDLSTLRGFSYSIIAFNSVGDQFQIVSSSSDSRLEYVRLEFYKYGPDEISGSFTIKTWSNTGGSGLYEQHHSINFTLYPTDNKNLFD